MQYGQLRNKTTTKREVEMRLEPTEAHSYVNTPEVTQEHRSGDLALPLMSLHGE